MRSLRHPCPPAMEEWALGSLYKEYTLLKGQTESFRERRVENRRQELGNNSKMGGTNMALFFCDSHYLSS